MSISSTTWSDSVMRYVMRGLSELWPLSEFLFTLATLTGSRALASPLAHQVAPTAKWGTIDQALAPASTCALTRSFMKLTRSLRS
eukprot:9495447-Pyramimonas_sp.AAC.1